MSPTGTGTHAVRVSAIVAAHNAAAFIGQAVDSVLAQDHGDIELIVVDDASTDGTAEVLQAHADAGRLRLVRLPRNQGVAAARNAGLRAATGEVIAFLDADDLWLPHHVSRALGVLARHPDIDVVLQNFAVRDLHSGAHLGDWFDLRRAALQALQCTPLEAQTQRVDGGFLGALMVGCFVHLQATVVRQAVCRQVMFDERLRCSEDVDWAARTVHVAGARWACVAQPSSVYHRHADSLTSDTRANHEAIELTGVKLFTGYLAWPGLSPRDRRLIRRALLRSCLDLSYFARQDERVAPAWRHWAHSLRHGLTRAQWVEGLKLLVLSPGMWWRGRSVRA